LKTKITMAYNLTDLIFGDSFYLGLCIKIDNKYNLVFKIDWVVMTHCFNAEPCFNTCVTQ